MFREVKKKIPHHQENVEFTFTEYSTYFHVDFSLTISYHYIALIVVFFIC